jgi:hypothetical protein
MAIFCSRLRGMSLNTCKVEVAPAFPRQGGGFLICDTNDGGKYKHVDPIAEIAALVVEI